MLLSAGADGSSDDDEEGAVEGIPSSLHKADGPRGGSEVHAVRSGSGSGGGGGGISGDGGGGGQAVFSRGASAGDPEAKKTLSPGEAIIRGAQRNLRDMGFGPGALTQSSPGGAGGAPLSGPPPAFARCALTDIRMTML